jgi:hypothetical protein
MNAPVAFCRSTLRLHPQKRFLETIFNLLDFIFGEWIEVVLTQKEVFSQDVCED